MSNLKDLKKIDGNLKILDNPKLEDLNLNNLNSISKSATIINNDKLKISARNLESVGGTLITDKLQINKEILTGNSNLENTFIGKNSLINNISGNKNTAIGVYSLAQNTTGSNNLAVGYNSLSNNILGRFNIAIGNESLLNNNSINNIAIGIQSLGQNTTGNNNLAVGNFSFRNNISGIYNTIIGTSCFNTFEDGNNNIGLGCNNCGSLIINGEKNIFIGNDSNIEFGQTDDFIKNRIAIGNSVKNTVDNTVVIGNSECTDVHLGSENNNANIHCKTLKLNFDLIPDISTDPANKPEKGFIYRNGESLFISDGQ